jgi:ABC-2 type transport system ATP-binding protein
LRLATLVPLSVLVILLAPRFLLGDCAAAHHIVLHELTPVRASLEEAFMDVTRDDVEFHAAAPPEHEEALA